MTRKKLPIGIQTFREIREDSHYYVDKTAFALKLIAEGKYYFHPTLRPHTLVGFEVEGV
jgi:hypothetical protein